MIVEMAVGVWVIYAHSRTCFQVVMVLFIVAMDGVDLDTVATSFLDIYKGSNQP